MKKPGLPIHLQAGIGAASLAVTALCFLGVRHMIVKQQRQATQRQSSVRGNPADFAMLFVTAFDGWAIDEALIYETLESIPNQATWKAVQEHYFKVERRELMGDLQSKLYDSEYLKARSIIQKIPPK